MPDRSPRFLGIKPDQHVCHQVLWWDSGSLKNIDTLEENALIAKVVPSGIEAALVETGVAVFDRRQRRRGFIVDQAHVYALTQAHMKATVLNLADARLPLLAWLP